VKIFSWKLSPGLEAMRGVKRYDKRVEDIARYGDLLVVKEIERNVKARRIKWRKRKRA
jgi:hypothetical protein